MISEGRTALKMAQHRPDLAPKAAQKVSRTEDSTRTAEHEARRTEIWPRTADCRLSRRPGLSANNRKPRQVRGQDPFIRPVMC